MAGGLWPGSNDAIFIASGAEFCACPQETPGGNGSVGEIGPLSRCNGCWLQHYDHWGKEQGDCDWL